MIPARGPQTKLKEIPGLRYPGWRPARILGRRGYLGTWAEVPRLRYPGFGTLSVGVSRDSSVDARGRNAGGTEQSWGVLRYLVT